MSSISLYIILLSISIPINQKISNILIPFFRLNERLLNFLGEVSKILYNSKPIMLLDDIRFQNIK